ncbi:PIN domain-containing protein [Nakamurella sp.]|uniref:PIN domain-containing protein n=1 Tax=Nakamurella sp. TaxID=1869182 RepID=UPI003782DBAF
MIVRPHSFLLDAEALSALAVADRRMQAWATVARRSGSSLHASTLTLAEVTDGRGRDAAVHRVAKALRLVEVTEQIGFAAGRLRAAAATARRKPRDLTVDAVVAATALVLTSPVVVLTSDPRDLRLLLSETTVRVEVIEP